jgi:hypothetical protein
MFSKKKPRVKFDNKSISQKKCHPGPNVKFKKTVIPISHYLTYYNGDGNGNSGCTSKPKTFPKYTDGKYCCEATPASDQEIFDYINERLENVIANVSDEQFFKQKHNIKFLLDHRKHYEQKQPPLEDKLLLPEPYKNIKEWFKGTMRRINEDIRMSNNANDVLVSDKSKGKKHDLETLNPRVLVQWDMPAKDRTYKLNPKQNPPSTKPVPSKKNTTLKSPSKSPSKPSSKSPSKLGGGKTRKKK